MVAALSTLLSSSNVLDGSNSRGISSSLGRPKISTCCFTMPVPTARRRRLKGIEAAIRESTIISPAASMNLHPLYRDQSAIAAVLDYKRMKEEEEEEEEERKQRDSVSAEMMDQWIQESIGEIVRNIGEAPFLVQIFSQGPSVLRLEREDASPESWPLVKKKWNQTSCMPDGIILVEELKDTEEEEEEEEEDAANDNNAIDAESQTWGLVVQGRGMKCAAPCYILNTCRVRSAAGFCTHFCLVRAKCFGETLHTQLNKAWLQGR